MLRRFSLLFFLGLSLLIGGAMACGTGGDGVVTIELSFNGTPLFPGDIAQVTAVAKDAQGNVITQVTFAYDSLDPRVATVNSSGIVNALYPGQAELIASIGSVVSNTLTLNVQFPVNDGNVTNLTNNTVDDDWSNNNNWPMISRGQILWLEYTAGGLPNTIQLGDANGGITSLKDVSAIGDVDFMALGSGDSDSNILAAWRENLANSFVSTGSGTPFALGAVQQEENTIANGLYLFRQNGSQSIQEFTLDTGLFTLASGGTLGSPITSMGQAIWLEDAGGGNFNIVYFDGTNTLDIDTGPFAPGNFDFRNGRIVYSLSNDIFVYDTTADNPSSVNITNAPQNLNNFVQTDGDSLVFTRAVNGGADNDVVLYNIDTGTQQVISTTDDPKNGNSLVIDFGQAGWREGNALFFFDGTSTSPVPVPGALETAFKAYLANGIVTWIGDEGNGNEVYVMQ